MDINSRVKMIRQMVVDRGGYKSMAIGSGVNYHWLSKFAQNAINNPGIANIAKLEKYLFDDDGN